MSTYQGNAFLGIDAGSTTTKLALVSETGALLYSYYGSNEGNPLKVICFYKRTTTRRTSLIQLNTINHIIFNADLKLSVAEKLLDRILQVLWEHLVQV